MQTSVRDLDECSHPLQDPLDPGRCVMVIRSLVPGGSAERRGGLFPGDQLVSVDRTQLDALTLDQALEVLKAVPLGTVRLGVRKPLSAVRLRLLHPLGPRGGRYCFWWLSVICVCRWRSHRGSARCLSTTHSCPYQR